MKTSKEGRPRIALGSKSPIKRAALAAALKRTGKDDWAIVAFDVDSGVPDQPEGREQTLLGARNRAQAVLKAAGGAVLLSVAVENGLWQDDDGFWVDGAAVVLLDAQGKEVAVAWSDVMRICHKRQCRLACDPDHEGRLLVEPGKGALWSALKDPHAVIAGKPRQAFLEETICALLLHDQEK